DHPDQGQALGDLVGDELRGGAHRAQERVLRARGPAAEHEAIEGDGAEREQVQRADADVEAVEPDRRAPDVDHGAEGDDGQRGDRGEDGQDRRDHEEQADRGGGAGVLLAQQLADVGDGLEQTVGADAVGAVAGLEAAEQLALGDEDDRDDRQPDGEDDHRLEELDPPLLGVDRRREAGHARRTSTSAPVRIAVSSETKTEPAGTALRSAARPRNEVPFWATSTGTPSSMPRRRASSGASSTEDPGWRNCSDGEIRTSG